MEIAELQAPPEVLQALQHDGRRSGRWIRARCPFCDPEGRKRRNLAASHTGFGRNRDRPGWVCHACHANEDLKAAKLARGKIRYDAEADKNDDKRRLAGALRIIESSRFVSDGDPVDLYLRGRGLLPPGPAWPTSLRFARLRHPADKQTYPAMVAVVTNVEGMPVAVHRTFLTDDGAKAQVFDSDGRKAAVKLSYGMVAGAAVRLGIDSETIVVAEGIESALGAAMATGYVPWSVLSTGNMVRLQLPRSVKRVVIATDNDPNEAGDKAAQKLRRNLKQLQIKQGREINVSIQSPDPGRSDFADFG